MVTGGGSGGGGGSVGGRQGEVDRLRKRMGSSFFTFGFLLFFLASVTKRYPLSAYPSARTEWSGAKHDGVFSFCNRDRRQAPKGRVPAMP